MPAESSWTPISTFTADGTATGVQFSNIPQTYTDLIIVQFLRSSRSATTEQFWQRFNNDQNSNYSYTFLQGNGSSASSSLLTNQTVTNRFYIPAASSTAGLFGSSIVTIPNYTNTSVNKTAFVQYACDLNASGFTGLSVGLWRSTAAITSINVATENGSNLVSGSIVTLFGVKAA